MDLAWRRGRLDGRKCLQDVTSYLLRIQDASDKEHEYRNFVSDLMRAGERIAVSRRSARSG